VGCEKAVYSLMCVLMCVNRVWAVNFRAEVSKFWKRSSFPDEQNIHFYLPCNSDVILKTSAICSKPCECARFTPKGWEFPFKLGLRRTTDASVFISRIQPVVVEHSIICVITPCYITPVSSSNKASDFYSWDSHLESRSRYLIMTCFVVLFISSGKILDSSQN